MTVAALRATDPYYVLLTMTELAEYLRYTSPRASEAALQWCRRYAVPVAKRGGRCLVRLAHVDAALAGEDLAAARGRVLSAHKRAS